jgi:nucleoside-diphosphate kinase
MPLAAATVASSITRSFPGIFDVRRGRALLMAGPLRVRQMTRGLAGVLHVIILNLLGFIVGVLCMAVERTLSIIKPDAVGKNVLGKIYSRFENAGLKIVGAQMRWLSRAEAEGFYAVHRERPFFKPLVEFMISGPVMIQVLEGEGAIATHRELMGATDPKQAAPGTIRADFAASIDANAVHGSDGLDTATFEIAYFFPTLAVFSR